MINKWETPFWIGERKFSREDLDLIIWTVKQYSDLSRTELAKTICENLDWKAPNGKERLHSCLDLLDKLVADKMILLPGKRKLVSLKKKKAKGFPVPELQVKCSLRELRPVSVDLVPPEEQALWDATMATYHPLGFKRAFGAHQRYWIHGHVDGNRVVVGAFLFAAPAINIKVRDEWLGWTQQEQQHYRSRIVSNNRMLILPGVGVPHLASHALGKVARRLPKDWQAHYGFSPVLLETLMPSPWRGTSYRAANWIHLGQTSLSRHQDGMDQGEDMVREVFVYPLKRDWQHALTADNTLPAQATYEKGDSSIANHNRLATDQRDERIKLRYETMAPFLNEKQRRLYAGSEALAYGTGGVKHIAALLKISPTTVSRGIKEARNPEIIETERIRQRGGGRKSVTELDPDLMRDLDKLISPDSERYPESPLRWTSKGTRRLANELQEMKSGRSVSSMSVSRLLHDMGYSLQGNRKATEGDKPADRDVQFQHINDRVIRYQQLSQPVISVDIRKRELFSGAANDGALLKPKAELEKVQVQDEMTRELGEIGPIDVNEELVTEGWVSVEIQNDTAVFAVASIRSWWQQMGRAAYPNATELLITADGGGDNRSHALLCKEKLQLFANESGLRIAVCHYPLGTSKWTAIEQKMITHSTQNWASQSLVNYEATVSLIAGNTTQSGLTNRRQMGMQKSQEVIKGTHEESLSLSGKSAVFLEEWNYTISPLE